MKKLLALILALAMVLSFAACGGEEPEQPNTDPVVDPAENAETVKNIKAGMVCIGDENDQGYTYNFIRATETAKEILAAEGINVEWSIKFNLVEGDPVAEANEELADDGCDIIYNNSYGQEPAMLQIAADYPETVFVGCTNEGSWKDDLSNTVNAFDRIHEGRYLAGVVAGLKMQEMIDNGEITPEQAVIGYVGAYSFAEVISGFSAYYLGAKSVCPSVTMKVQFVGDWSNATLEANAAQALCDKGCIMISQHSDNTTPATVAEQNGVFHTGYNADMIAAAPKASIISTRIDWTNYFVYTIECIANGEEIDPDYAHGLAEGEVVLTELNEDICAAGTAEKIAEVEAGIIDGSIKVFDIDTFTVGGEKVTSCFGLDTNGDFVADSGEAIYDGEFHESTVPGLQSAPYFALRIDGIEWLNEAY